MTARGCAWRSSTRGPRMLARPLAARRAVVVLPVSQDGPAAARRRAARDRPRPHRLRPLGQARGARGLHLRPPLGWLTDLVVGRLELRDAVLFCQDWGGLLGLRLVAEHPRRFAAVVASNTMLPTGDHDPGEAFRAWRDSRARPGIRCWAHRRRRGRDRAVGAELAAYDAPFPDDSYKAGARQFPSLVPIAPDDPEAAPNRAAWEVLSRSEKPFVCAFGDSDPITAVRTGAEEAHPGRRRTAARADRGRRPFQPGGRL